MARTFKKGVDYFPFNVDFFQDEKIQFVSARFGLKGEVVAIRLLCHIYRKGYFTEWSEDTTLLFAKSVGDGCQHSFVNDVVRELLKRGFFDRSIFERFGVLTSKGIQNRFFDAVSRYKRVEVVAEYLLVDVAEMKNVCIIGINVNTNGSNADTNPHNESENGNGNGSEIPPLLPPKKFDFGKVLIQEYGCDKQHVSDYLLTRKKKRLANTETALNEIIVECEKHNFPVKDAIKECAARGWGGFRVKWLENEKERNYGANQGFSKNSNQRPTSEQLAAAVQAGIGLANAGQ